MLEKIIHNASILWVPISILYVNLTAISYKCSFPGYQGCRNINNYWAQSAPPPKDCSFKKDFIPLCVILLRQGMTGLKMFFLFIFHASELQIHMCA